MQDEAPIPQTKSLQQRTITTDLTIGPPIEVGTHPKILHCISWLWHEIIADAIQV